MTAAHSTLPNGTLVRWHDKPLLTECRSADCPRPHVSPAELNTLAADEWWEDYTGDDPAIRGALGLEPVAA